MHFMKKIFAALLCSFTIFTAAVSAQNTDEEDVVKITSKLVQLDVVVTDSKGNCCQAVREPRVSMK